MKNILIVASHPDDEALGCGGTISRLSKEGNTIHILILGQGLPLRDYNKDKNKLKKAFDKLHSESKLAGKLLGAKYVEIKNLPDNRLDSINLLDIIKIIEIEIRKFEPEIIFTHHPGDLNIDHRLTFEAVLTATRPLPGQNVKEIYSFEIPSSTEYQFQTSENSFKPNVYFEISKVDIKNKIKAMQSYSTERRVFPHPRSSKSLEALAKWRGSNIGKNYAECFELIRFIK